MDIETVEKLLENRDRTELYDIIAQLSDCSDEAEEWLLDYCSRKSGENNSALIAEKQIRHYWYMAEDIIDDANTYGGTKDEDDAYYALNMIDDLARENEISWECRKEIVDGMLKQFYIGNSGFEDKLIESCETLCKTNEENLYLADKISESPDGYYKKYAAGIYLKCGNTEKFIELQSENLEYGSDYIRLADFYKENDQADKAVALVEKGLKKCDGRLDIVFEWLYSEYKQRNQEDKIHRLYKIALEKDRDVSTMTRLMYEYYSDDYEKKKPYLLKMIEVCRDYDAKEWYDECKKVLTLSDFEKESERLHECLKERNTEDYLQLRIDEGNTEEVLDFLKKSSLRSGYYYGLNYGHYLAEQLASDYPKDVADMYWRECESLCTTSNKNRYMRATYILKEIKSICEKAGLQQEWAVAFDSFMENHSRRKLLMGYINEEEELKR